MTPQEMWNAYKKINPSMGEEMVVGLLGGNPPFWGVGF